MVRTVAWLPERLANVEKMRAVLPTLEVVVDEKRDAFASLEQACGLLNQTGGFLFEDDVQLCDGFVEKSAAAIQECGQGREVVNFFELPKRWYKTERRPGRDFFFMQCVYLPPFVPNRITRWREQFLAQKPEMGPPAFATDRLIGYALAQDGLCYWRVRPGLVQHLDFRSAFTTHRSTKRQTPYFIDDLVAAGLNYDEMDPAKGGPNYQRAAPGTAAKP